MPLYGSEINNYSRDSKEVQSLLDFASTISALYYVY